MNRIEFSVGKRLGIASWRWFRTLTRQNFFCKSCHKSLKATPLHMKLWRYLQNSPDVFFRISPNKTSGRSSKHETAQAVRWVDFSFSKELRVLQTIQILATNITIFLCTAGYRIFWTEFCHFLGRRGPPLCWLAKRCQQFSVYQQLVLLQLRPSTWLPIMVSLSLLNSSLKQAPIPGTRTGLCRCWRPPF